MPDRQNPYLFPPLIAPPRTLNDVPAAGSASFGHSVGTFSGRDYVLFDALNPRYVLSGDTQRPPLLFSLVFGEPEMDDCVFDDDISRPNLEPLLSLKPFLSHQLGQQFVANGSIVATDVGRGVVPGRR